MTGDRLLVIGKTGLEDSPPVYYNTGEEAL